MALVVKNPPFNAGDVREVGSVCGSGKSPGGEHGNPLQYSCLENPMDRGDWQAIVNRVTESHTTEVTSQVGTHVYITRLSLDLLPEPPSSSLSDFHDLCISMEVKGLTKYSVDTQLIFLRVSSAS